MYVFYETYYMHRPATMLITLLFKNNARKDSLACHANKAIGFGMDRYFGWLRWQIGSMEDTYTIQSCIWGYHSIRKFRCHPGTTAFRSCTIFSVCNFFLGKSSTIICEAIDSRQYSIDLSQGGLEVSIL